MTHVSWLSSEVTCGVLDPAALTVIFTSMLAILAVGITWRVWAEKKRLRKAAEDGLAVSAGIKKATASPVLYPLHFTYLVVSCATCKSGEHSLPVLAAFASLLLCRHGVGLLGFGSVPREIRVSSYTSPAYSYSFVLLLR